MQPLRSIPVKALHVRMAVLTRTAGLVAGSSPSREGDQGPPMAAALSFEPPRTPTKNWMARVGWTRLSLLWKAEIIDTKSSRKKASTCLLAYLNGTKDINFLACLASFLLASNIWWVETPFYLWLKIHRFDRLYTNVLMNNLIQNLDELQTAARQVERHNCNWAQK